MIRIGLFVILAVWFIGAEEVARPSLSVRPGLWLFLGGYLFLIAIIAIWARVLSRRTLNASFFRSSRRFHRFVHHSRYLIPIWLALGFLHEVGWAHLVLALTGSSFQSPALLLGTLPALLTWVGIWAAEYPADRARREHALVSDFEHDLPVHAPPGFGRWFAMSIRQQLLPVLLPVLLILVLRDLAMLIARPEVRTLHEQIVLLAPGLIVYLMAPEIVRRLFDTRSLEPSPLRRRLEEICRRCNLRYRDILLWRTDFSIANAAVVGLLPRWRYVLLSDRLLETMSDEHIEAVFAHEMGHIVHHHLAWLVVFFITFTLLAAGPGQWLDDWIVSQFPTAFSGGAWLTIWHVATAALGFVSMLFTLGLLARRFEQQADVHAARMMEAKSNGEAPTATPVSHPAPRASFIGARGAAVYAGALERVAHVNDVPLSASDLFHPSIEKRLRQVRDLSRDPKRTRDFDRSMRLLFAGLLLAFASLAALILLTH